MLYKYWRVNKSLSVNKYLNEGGEWFNEYESKFASDYKRENASTPSNTAGIQLLVIHCMGLDYNDVSTNEIQIDGTLINFMRQSIMAWYLNMP